MAADMKTPRNRVVPCSECGQSAEVTRGNYEFKEAGLNKIVLSGIEMIRCAQCGNEDPIIPRVNDLMNAIAIGIVMKPYGLNGEEVRFLRKYLHMTADGFARVLHVDKTTVSKWENDEQAVGPQSDLAIRMIVVGLGEDMLDKLAEIIKSFEAIQFRRHQKRIKSRAVGRATKQRKVNRSNSVLQIDMQTLATAYA